MDAFTPLRKLAREKRDRLISAARADYEATLDQINAIERRLATKSPRQGYTTASLCAVLPRDTPFTVPGILDALESAGGAQVWTRKAVSNLVGKLRRRGLIRRTRRANANRPAIYIRADAQSPPPAFSDAALPEVVKSVLTRPMNATEIAQAVVEAGYPSSQSPKGLRHCVMAALRKGGYRRLARGKWDRPAP